MKFGLLFGSSVPANALEVARKADELGFDSIWVGHHILPPMRIPSTYPYAASGQPPFTPESPWYDPWVELSYLAAGTSRLRLGTSVFVLPMVDPFSTARAVATLDVVSGGRAVLGIGVGWMKDEFDVLGIDFKTRLSRTEETVRLLRLLWTEDRVEFRGRHFSVGPVTFNPKPVQRPIPIHVGGDSDAALRRAARIGDGWIGVWYDVDRAREHVARLRQLLGEEGRETVPFEITIQSSAPLTPDAVKRLDELGVHRLKVRPWSQWPDAIEGMERFAEQLMR